MFLSNLHYVGVKRQTWSFTYFLKNCQNRNDKVCPFWCWRIWWSFSLSLPLCDNCLPQSCLHNWPFSFIEVLKITMKTVYTLHSLEIFWIFQSVSVWSLKIPTLEKTISSVHGTLHVPTLCLLRQGKLHVKNPLRLYDVWISQGCLSKCPLVFQHVEIWKLISFYMRIFKWIWFKSHALRMYLSLESVNLPNISKCGRIFITRKRKSSPQASIFSVLRSVVRMVHIETDITMIYGDRGATQHKIFENSWRVDREDRVRLTLWMMSAMSMTFIKHLNHQLRGFGPLGAKPPEKVLRFGNLFFKGGLLANFFKVPFISIIQP